MRKRDQRGFTLIELLVVVGIIAILAAMAVFQLTQYRTKAYNAAAESDLRNFRTAMEAVFSDQRSYPPL